MDVARRDLMAVALATFLLTACGSDDPAGPDPEGRGELLLSIAGSGEGGGDVSIVHHDAGGLPPETLALDENGELQSPSRTTSPSMPRARR